MRFLRIFCNPQLNRFLQYSFLLHTFEQRWKWVWFLFGALTVFLGSGRRKMKNPAPIRIIKMKIKMNRFIRVPPDEQQFDCGRFVLLDRALGQQLRKVIRLLKSWN